VIVEEETHLAHYGILRKSGRYPWGSGKDPVQRSMSFFDTVQKLRDDGLSDVEIARGLGMTTGELRQTNTIAIAEKKAADIAQAVSLKDKGYSNVAIGEKMGINESSVRSLIAASQKERVNILKTTSDMLRRQVEEQGYVDVGKGNENILGISKEKLGSALAILKDEGYVVERVQVSQAGTQHKTTMKVLAPPGTTYRDIVSNIDKIGTLTEVSKDGGRTLYGHLPPLPVSSKRVGIKYKEDGGDAADGVIYVRPGVKDLSLGNAKYAQVRIDVDGTHYLKGMAMYKDDLPKGTDLLFNTNKSKSDPKVQAEGKLGAMKKQTDDPDNPFGAVFDQIGKREEGTGRLLEVTSAMNIVNEEGDWDKWSRTLSSQTLSKQSPVLAKSQLDLSFETKRSELEGIQRLTNPAVKKLLLEKYAESADASAVHLQAARLPRSSWHVILPLNSMKENEIYAPNFRDGERVALIRYPHGGTFEIPELTVNNRHSAARAAIGVKAKDAVGINSEVAKRLSGADFDGDAVLVIPNNNRSIKTQPSLAGLKDFDPQRAYPKYEGMKVMDAREKGREMGRISNLITDMTIQNANTTEIAAAVRHSMVVIDAEKHELNWKLSAQRNGIPNLMRKYQGKPTGGASTLISRAGAQIRVDARVPRRMSKGGPVDPATGKKVWEPTGETYVDRKTGKTVKRKIISKKLAETDDAHTLVSKDGGTPIERVYADHSNRLKALANQARKEAVNTRLETRSPSAAKAYHHEVQSLNAKLNVALRNAPRERTAQRLADTTIQAKRRAQPDMDETQLKRVKSQALTEARARAGAKKELVDITPKEWEAIQAGAISKSKLKGILDNADIEKVKELATPRTTIKMTSTKLNRARSMENSGYTQAEIADALGVSLTTLKEGLKDG
jgi:hypothetical protein